MLKKKMSFEEFIDTVVMDGEFGWKYEYSIHVNIPHYNGFWGARDNLEV